MKWKRKNLCCAWLKALHDVWFPLPSARTSLWGLGKSVYFQLKLTLSGTHTRTHTCACVRIPDWMHFRISVRNSRASWWLYIYHIYEKNPFELRLMNSHPCWHSKKVWGLWKLLQTELILFIPIYCSLKYIFKHKKHCCNRDLKKICCCGCNLKSL